MFNLKGELLPIENQQDLGRAVNGCAKNRVGMLVTGGRERPLAAPGDEELATLSLAPMNKIIEHEVDDLIITCEAGCTIDQITRTVSPHGQRLAIDVASPELATIGGVVSSGLGGFLQPALGQVRDQILGMKIMLSSGKVAKTGGRVVKNVTGYELAKLFTGSRGALGIITEMTLRLRPLPAATQTCVITRESAEEAFELALALRDVPGTITGLAVGGGRPVAPGTGPWLVLARVEGSEKAVADIGSRIDLVADNHYVVEADDADGMWQSLLNFPTDQGFWTRINLLPSRLAAAAKRLIRSAETDEFGLVADVPAGTLHFTLPDVGRDIDTTVGQLVLGRLSRDLECNVAIPSDPADHLERENRFGGPGAATAALLQRIKDAFDPDGLMAPGRLTAKTT